MVGVAGFEPATPSSRTRCSTRLSHTPTSLAGGLIALPLLGCKHCQKPIARSPSPEAQARAKAGSTEPTQKSVAGTPASPRCAAAIALAFYGPHMWSNTETSRMPAIDTVVARANPATIERARSALSAGRLVAFPTETVYGLGADAANDRAVAKLYAAKERPSFNPLIAHVADLAAARRLAQFDAEALKLAEAFWPGPLTLVLPKLRGCPVGQLATSGLDTIAVRAPSHPVARDNLAAFGKPVVAPSANRSGRVSPTSAKHVQADLAGRIDLIIDGGASPLGLESTILACRGRTMLLRPGAIPRATIESFLGHDIAVATPSLPSPASGGGKGGGGTDG